MYIDYYVCVYRESQCANLAIIVWVCAHASLHMYVVLCARLLERPIVVYSLCVYVRVHFLTIFHVFFLFIFWEWGTDRICSVPPKRQL